MGVTLGVDIGGSTTKVAGSKDGGIFSVLQVRASDQKTSAYGAIGRFLEENRLVLADIDRVVLTGVGEYKIKGDVFGRPTARIDEFTSIARGGLILAGIDRAIIVSMGTGTALVRADGENITHLGGSGVGGGTLMGLCGKFFNIHSFDTISTLSKQGDLYKVDLMVSDILSGNLSTLTNDMTAANLGKLSDSASDADVVNGIINIIVQTAGVMAVFACRNDDIQTVVLTGSLTELPLVRPTFELMEKAFGVHFIIPERAVFATAIGAALFQIQ